MIRFLTKEILIHYHRDQVRRYGGSDGIRDEGLLDSALAQPQATFGGTYIHKDLFHMAAAYGYHLCQNHPFVDGNKRMALIAMYLFLFANGYEIVADKKSLYAIVIDLASGKVQKEEIAEYLKNHSRNRA